MASGEAAYIVRARDRSFGISVVYPRVVPDTSREAARIARRAVHDHVFCKDIGQMRRVIYEAYKAAGARRISRRSLRIYIKAHCAGVVDLCRIIYTPCKAARTVPCAGGIISDPGTYTAAACKAVLDPGSIVKRPGKTAGIVANRTDGDVKRNISS